MIKGMLARLHGPAVATTPPKKAAPYPRMGRFMMTWPRASLKSMRFLRLLDELQLLEFHEDLFLGQGTQMAIHLFAFGVQIHLGRDGQDLILLKERLFFIQVDHAKFHLVAMTGFQCRHYFFHLFAGDAGLGSEFIEGGLALGRSRTLGLGRQGLPKE
jgi:hypothetical protein